MKRRIFSAIAIALLVTTATLGHTPSKIEPVPQALFKEIDIPSLKPTQTPNLSTFTDFRKEIEVNRRILLKLPQIKPKIAPKHVFLPKMPSKTDAQHYALGRLGQTQYNCVYKLFKRESNWRWNARNRYSGAYGIPQALPGSKMAKAGSDWRTNPITQVKWGLSYIRSRYGTACNAWRHSQNHGWY